MLNFTKYFIAREIPFQGNYFSPKWIRVLIQNKETGECRGYTDKGDKSWQNELNKDILINLF